MRTRLLFSTAALCGAGLLPRSAHAASLQKVGQDVWGVGGLPSYVNMYLYLPDKLAAKPPILVASHHCGGTATTTYNETKSSFVSLADKNGFIIVFPEATGHNCWDVGSSKSLAHDGGGDTHAIARMVRYTLAKYDADAGRVYAFGGSSGAMMTQALMGVYPDLFRAGVAVSGVPCGCWAVNYSGNSASNGQWSGPCAGGQVSKTAQQWGDQVRSMFIGYSGHRPRLQLWHGTADTTISFKNFDEAVKEWTNVLGLSQAPTTSDIKFGGPHALWKNACGYGVLDTYAITGAGHGVNWDANTAASFLGLDQVRSTDPETAACSPSGGGGTASGGAGGATASGGAAGDGSSAGAPSASGAGGAGAGSGGAPGTGGTPSGAAGMGGVRSDAGAPAVGGALAIGGAFGTAGTPPALSPDADPQGCSCVLVGRARGGAWSSALLLVLGLGVAIRRRAQLA